MEKLTTIETIAKYMEFMAASNRAEIAKFQAEIAEGRSIRQAVEWAETVIMAEITLGFLARIERATTNGTDLIEMLCSMKERMEEDLLGNRFTQSSTGAFHRAVEGTEAEATSRFYKTITEWLKLYSNSTD